MPASGEEHQRVVLARRQAARARSIGAENSDRQHADDARARCVTNRAKLSATTTPKLDGVAVPEQHAARRARRREADEAERRRSASARPGAERLGDHRGEGREGHADDRDDGGERGAAASAVSHFTRRAAAGTGRTAPGSAASTTTGRTAVRRGRVDAPPWTSRARRCGSRPAPSASGTGSGTRPSRSAAATSGSSRGPLARRQVGQRRVLLVASPARSSRAGTSRACRRPTG